MGAGGVQDADSDELSMGGRTRGTWPSMNGVEPTPSKKQLSGGGVGAQDKGGNPHRVADDRLDWKATQRWRGVCTFLACWVSVAFS